VRLVDDHQRAVVMKEVCEGEPHAVAAVDALHRVERLDPRKMRLELLVVRVDLAVRRVGDAEGLGRADDEAGLSADILGADVG
jgi:hypothetical protein